MKNIKLPFLCGADMRDRLPSLPRERDRAGAGGNARGAGTSRSQRRDSGPLDALSPRARHGFTKGLSDWVAQDAAGEEERGKAADSIRKAAAEGKEVLMLPHLALTLLPTQIGALRRLQELDLRHNRLSNLPASIGDLVNLIRLLVDFNRLESLPDELKHATQLRHISAESNKLSRVPKSMATLMQLRTVNLKSNQIWQLPPEWGELLKRLRRLDLSDNELRALPASQGDENAGEWTSVRSKGLELNLSNNPIADLPKSYGSFKYKPFSNDLLVNAAGNVVVHSARTGLRQGLAARLGEGRGVFRRAAAQRRPPGPVLDGESDDESLHSVDSLDSPRSHDTHGTHDSFGDYVRRHGAQGQAFGRPRSSELQSTSERQGWNWFGSTEPLNAAAGANTRFEVPRPFARNERAFTHDAGVRQSAVDRGHPNIPAGATADLTSELTAALLSLPEAERTAVLTYLKSVPPHVVEATLAQMQSARVRAAGGMVPPAGAPAMGGAPLFGATTHGRFATQTGQPFVFAVPRQFTEPPVVPTSSTVPPVPEPAHTAQHVPPSTVPETSTQTMPPPVTPPVAPGPRPSSLRSQERETPPSWASAELSWSQPSRPFVRTRNGRPVASQGGADQWAPPQWVAAPGASGEEGAEGETSTPGFYHETSAPGLHAGLQSQPTHAWTSAPVPDSQASAQPEEPGILDMLETIMRKINGE
jgi:Leucine rich repeat